jgi:hypothetical protein
MQGPHPPRRNWNACGIKTLVGVSRGDGNVIPYRVFAAFLDLDLQCATGKELFCEAAHDEGYE